MAAAIHSLLSGGTNGKNIKVTGTGTGSSVTVHTAQSGTAGKDAIHLYAVNNHTATVDLTIEFGGTAADDLIIKTLPPKDGVELIVPGFLINNSVVIKAFASVANVVNLNGYVNKITD